MTGALRVLVLLSGWIPLAVAACARSSEPAAPPWLDVFAVYPGARLLCTQHVTGNSMHIVWSAYATPSAPAEVASFYEAHRGDLTVERNDAVINLRASNDRVLSVYPKDAQYPRCDVKPSSSDATVILVSQAIR